jgi:Tfp pilus assembly protein PilO
MKKMAALYKIIGLIFFIAIFSLTYHFSLHEQYSNYLDAHLASRGLKQNIENIKKDFKEKDIYSTQFAKIQTTFNEQMVALPKAQNFNIALNTVKTAAENAHLQFQTMTPSSPVPKDFYVELPVQMTILGTYQQILDFMQITSSWKGPLFIWQNWTLSHQFKPKTTVLNETTNNDLLQMNVNAVFFYTP